MLINGGFINVTWGGKLGPSEQTSGIFSGCVTGRGSGLTEPDLDVPRVRGCSHLFSLSPRGLVFNCKSEL